MPASALASRQIIEQSSYTTTPDQSSTDPTPPCGEAVFKKPFDADSLQKVDLYLQIEQRCHAEDIESCRGKMIEGMEKKKTTGRQTDIAQKREIS